MKSPLFTRILGILGILIIFLTLASSCGKSGTGKGEGITPTKDRNTKELAGERSVPENPKEELNENGVVITHAVSTYSKPKYPENFQHFEYVNPNAPKGGTLVQAGTGTFDNFNRFAQRGIAAPLSTDIYDNLLVQSEDEIKVYYGLIAKQMEYDLNYDWIIFHLQPEARHQDGKPITADDVVFSFNKFMKEGVTQFRKYYETVESAEALDEQRVKFSLSEVNKEILVSLGLNPILPPAFWRGRDLGEPLNEPPLGSGPYRVSDFSMGQFVEYERLKDYWALNLPPIRGTLNFDYVRFDMYRDSVIQLEALKAGEVDLRLENVSRQWATDYTGSNFDKGYIVTEEIPHEVPPGMQGFVFNTQRAIFADRRVREALSYVMDFEWMNRNLFYSQYERSRSYFQNTPYEALGLPSEEELKILEPVKDGVPLEVFTTEYNPPVNDGSGNIRAQIARALELLQEAGWEIKNQVLVNSQSGETFEFEMLIYAPSMERVALPLQENLKKLGITMTIRRVDVSQFTNRLRERDYDMKTTTFPGIFYPDQSLRRYWHSDFLDSTYNSTGVQDETIDYLIEGIKENAENNAQLQHWGKALDRVLQWNYFVIPQWHIRRFRVAYWDRFGQPGIRPLYSTGIGTWWLDEEKATRLPISR